MVIRGLSLFVVTILPEVPDAMFQELAVLSPLPLPPDAATAEAALSSAGGRRRQSGTQ